MDLGKGLSKFVLDALVIDSEVGVSDPLLDDVSGLEVFYFSYGGVRFRVNDRYQVEDKLLGQVGWGRGVAALLLESSLRHRAALLRVKVKELRLGSVGV